MNGDAIDLLRSMLHKAYWEAKDGEQEVVEAKMDQHYLTPRRVATDARKARTDDDESATSLMQRWGVYVPDVVGAVFRSASDAAPALDEGLRSALRSAREGLAVDNDENQLPRQFEDVCSLARELWRRQPTDGGHAVLLKDEDLLSVVVAALTDMSVTVLDADGRVVETIDELAVEHDLDVRAEQFDVLENEPRSDLAGRADTVLLSPRNTTQDVGPFCYHGVAYLRNEREAELHLALSPYHVGTRSVHLLQERFLRSGLYVDGYRKRQSTHPLAETPYVEIDVDRFCSDHGLSPDDIVYYTDLLSCRVVEPDATNAFVDLVDEEDPFGSQLALFER